MSKPLQHTPADITRWALIALGLGVEPTQSNYQGNDWPVSAHGMPPSPDNAIAVYVTTPQLDGRSLCPDQGMATHWAFQIAVRGANDFGFAFPKAEAIRVTLNEKVNGMSLTVSKPASLPATTYIIPCFSGLSLVPVGRESPDSKRFIYTINGYLVVRAL